MPDPCSARTRTLRIISIFLPPFSLDVVRSFGHNKYPIAQTSTATTAAIAVASSGVTNGGMDEVCHLPRRPTTRFGGGGSKKGAGGGGSGKKRRMINSNRRSPHTFCFLLECFISLAMD